MNKPENSVDGLLRADTTRTCGGYMVRVATHTCTPPMTYLLRRIRFHTCVLTLLKGHEPVPEMVCRLYTDLSFCYALLIILGTVLLLQKIFSSLPYRYTTYNINHSITYSTNNTSVTAEQPRWCFKLLTHHRQKRHNTKRKARLECEGAIRNGHTASNRSTSWPHHSLRLDYRRRKPCTTS
jgi:hypothetical protein